MEIHLITLIALLALGIIGITVGVANDAVNFLNSSIGSRVASMRVILFIAALGIVAGVTFSSGMMEIARKGIFNPEHFILEEVLIIFFAVMIQNVILLDLFNTYGLPTSTTVSLVFGLFGGALAVSLLKIISGGQSFDMIVDYLNISKLLAIISGIFLSIIFAFIFGTITQYLSRLLFTFDFMSRVKKYGGVWGGLAISFITYFIVIKGAKGSSFIPDETVLWIQTHTLEVMLISFVSWAIILQILISVFKINILKIIVLTGTFAIAMAFAANDLVNFIGAPLGGLNAYTMALEMDEPLTTTMGVLAEPFKANTVILLLSGLIMVMTLIWSKKSRSVTKTEINLSRQDEGFERFESYAVSRMVVRLFIGIFDFTKKIVPQTIQDKVSKRFDITKYKPELDENGQAPSYDLIRAAVNLVVASALIAYGTSLKLPLSTTYVTFIVAMSTALPDRAWGRESAVYRVSGVLTVIGGWFFTAIMAIILSMMVAAIAYYGNIYGIVGLFLLSLFIIYRSTRLHKKRELEAQEQDNHFLSDKFTFSETFEYLFENVSTYIQNITTTLTLTYAGVNTEDLKLLNKARKQSKKIYKDVDYLLADVLKSLKFADEKKLESGHKFAKALGALHEMAARLLYITRQAHDYFDNNHRKFQPEQIEELKNVIKEFNKIMKVSADAFNEKNVKELKKIAVGYGEINALIGKYNRNQLKRIKKSTANKRRSILFLNILDDTQGIVNNLLRVASSFKVFYKAEVEENE